MTTTLAVQSSRLDRAIQTCLAGLSPHTRRAYAARIAKFLEWSRAGAGRGLTRGDVTLWAQSLTDCGQSAIAVNQALSAVKRLAQEAASLGWMDWDEAVRVQSVRSRKYQGVRSGQWLTLAQVRALLALPDRTTLAGARDAAVLALLVGCGLRRAEACSLTVSHLRWKLTETGPVLVIENLTGKGNRVRTIQVPGWAAGDIRSWMETAGITEGKILRSLKQ